MAAYAATGDGVNYYMFADATGRVNRLGYDYYGCPANMQVVNLDRIDKKNVHHLVIIMDGFGYNVVKDFYDRGHLRMFYPPSRDRAVPER